MPSTKDRYSFAFFATWYTMTTLPTVEEAFDSIEMDRSRQRARNKIGFRCEDITTGVSIF